MRWLSITWEDSSNRMAIQLPCPSIDLIRLVGAAGNRKEIMSLLRLNPTLMTFALSKCEHKDSSDLVDWANDHLILALLDEKQVTTSRRFRKYELAEGLRPYFRARSNAKFRRSILKFIQAFSGAQYPQADLKRMVKGILGTEIRADQFKSKSIRHDATLKQAIKNWQNDWGNDSSDTPLKLEELFQLAVSNAELRKNFDQRLHEEKLASMKQLAYGASHEINNPLANIATRAQTMLAVEDSPQKRHKLSVIYEQAIRAHEMISDMMLFAHPPALKRQTVSLRLLMSKLVNELKPTFDASPEIDFKVVVGAGVDQASLDPTQISVSIKNLIQNSIQAIGSAEQPGGRIDVRIEQSDVIEVSVCDNGQGISDLVRRHLFDPFFSGREAGRGLGFGLSKVWTIAKLHGGEINFDSSDEHGTRFMLTIPIAAPNHSNSRLATASELVISNDSPNVEEEAA